MSDHESEDIGPKGNEWEVVALTESTYAASPGPKEVTSDGSIVGVENPETAQAMFMSGHFGSPSEQKNVSQEQDRPVPTPKVEQTGKLGLGSKNDEDINMEGLISGEFPGEEKIIEKVENISLYSSDFEDVMRSKLSKEHDMFDTGKSESFSDEAKAGRSLMDEDSMITKPIESLDHSDDSEVSDMPKHIEGDDFNDLSHENWWRKHALSLYAHAKNVNPVWSIVVAAAVVGLVIVGYRWQRNRQQVMQLKPRLVADDEGSRWIMGPVTRLKDVTLNAQNSPYIRVLSAAEH